MMIVTQNRKAIYNFDDISKIAVRKDCEGITIETISGGSADAGRYHGVRACQRVIGMMSKFAEEGKNVFWFPKEDSINVSVYKDDKANELGEV